MPERNMHSACLLAKALPAVEVPAWNMKGVRCVEGSIVSRTGDLEVLAYVVYSPHSAW
jgi:hypothetical protein